MRSVKAVKRRCVRHVQRNTIICRKRAHRNRMERFKQWSGSTVSAALSPKTAVQIENVPKKSKESKKRTKEEIGARRKKQEEKQKEKKQSESVKPRQSIRKLRNARLSAARSYRLSRKTLDPPKEKTISQTMKKVDEKKEISSSKQTGKSVKRGLIGSPEKSSDRKIQKMQKSPETADIKDKAMTITALPIETAQKKDLHTQQASPRRKVLSKGEGSSPKDQCCNHSKAVSDQTSVKSVESVVNHVEDTIPPPISVKTCPCEGPNSLRAHSEKTTESDHVRTNKKTGLDSGVDAANGEPFSASELDGSNGKTRLNRSSHTHGFEEVKTSQRQATATPEFMDKASTPMYGSNHLSNSNSLLNSRSYSSQFSEHRIRLLPKDIEYCKHMVDNHGDDYEAMVEDPENIYGDTVKSMQRKMKVYLRDTSRYLEFLRSHYEEKETDN